jgi:hypothetical protein
MRATAPETAHACAAEMSAATTEVATTTKMTAAAKMAATATTAAATAMSTASAAAAGRIHRARKRERKSNHGKELELRHGILLQRPSLASKV